MGAKVFSVRYPMTLGAPRLAPNESYYPWDDDCWGVAVFEDDAIRLSGKRKMGLAGNLLTLGPAQALLKGAVAKSLEEVIPVSDLARVVVSQRRASDSHVAFTLHQKREDGTVFVHSFVTGLLARKDEPTSAEAIAFIVAMVPADILTFEGVAGGVAAAVPAEWYPDPSGAHQFRYWDGAQWTAQVADDGRQSFDPIRT